MRTQTKLQTTKVLRKGDEAYLPHNAGKAFGRAYRAAIKKNLPVLVAKNDVLYKVFPNGKRIKVKELNPSVSILDVIPPGKVLVVT